MFNTRMILALLPIDKMSSMLAEHSDKIIDYIEEKAVSDVKLLPEEEKACLFLFMNGEGENKTLLAMVVTVDKQFTVKRKVKYYDLKKELGKINIKKIVGSLKDKSESNQTLIEENQDGGNE